MFRILCICIGYFIGCAQAAFIVGKLFGKIDIREHGSGNAGTTNVTRVLGAKAGLIVFVLDILKGLLGFMVCALLFHGSSSFIEGATGILPGLYGGLGVVLGHNYPFYLNFKGGKGIASTVGVIFLLDLRVALMVYAIGIFGGVITQYVSVVSLLITVSLPLFLFIFRFDGEVVALGFVFTLLAVYGHRKNIQRLLNGTENKFTIGKVGNKDE